MFTAAYFGSSVIISMAALFGLLWIYRVDVHSTGYTPISSSHDDSLFDISPATPQLVFPSVRYVTWSIFVNFLVTLSLFPALTSAVSPVSSGTSFIQRHFVSMHFLAMNISDFIGKAITIFPLLARMSPKRLFAASLARILFLPLLFACNIVFHDRIGEKIPTFFPTVFGDFLFFVLICALGFTNGYINTVAFIEAPDCLSSNGLSERIGAFTICGDLMAISLALGLASGSMASFGLRGLLCKCNPFYT
jgi:equilibrative nucleoside transporter 1/2/3